MELLSEYIRNAEYVKGLYVMKLHGMITDEFAEDLITAFQDAMPGRPVILIPEDIEVAHYDRFSLPYAVQLLKDGYKVGMEGKSLYYFMRDERLFVKDVDNGIETEVYSFTLHEINSMEWMIHEDNARLRFDTSRYQGMFEIDPDRLREAASGSPMTNLNPSPERLTPESFDRFIEAIFDDDLMRED